MAEILVVDDSETFRIQLSKDLESLGHTVTQAKDGRDAIEIIEKHRTHFNLIFCDINMPGITGIETLEILEEKQLLKNLMIFMLTTEGSKELKEKGKKLGVKAWITKPYNKERVLAAVSRVLTD